MRGRSHLKLRVALMAVAVGVIVMLLRSLETKLVFFPAPASEGDWQPRGLTFEDAAITTEDGVKLHGWFFPALQGRNVAPMLFSHGNAGNVATWAPAAFELWRRTGAPVLLYDYRGYGKSQGTPTAAGIVKDGRAARKWLAERTKVPVSATILVGRSLGGGVSVRLAAEDGARALILQNTFNSLVAVAEVVMPWVPAGLLLSDRLDSAETIKRYKGPLLQSHGDADELIPMALAEKLHSAANQPKTFVGIRGGGHNSPEDSRYYEALEEFLQGL